jgi:hypothetical protein
VRKLVTRMGRPTDLRPKEFLLLECLVRSAKPSGHADDDPRASVGYHI